MSDTGLQQKKKTAASADLTPPRGAQTNPGARPPRNRDRCPPSGRARPAPPLPLRARRALTHPDPNCGERGGAAEPARVSGGRRGSCLLAAQATETQRLGPAPPGPARRCPALPAPPLRAPDRRRPQCACAGRGCSQSSQPGWSPAAAALEPRGGRLRRAPGKVWPRCCEEAVGNGAGLRVGREGCSSALWPQERGPPPVLGRHGACASFWKTGLSLSSRRACL